MKNKDLLEITKKIGAPLYVYDAEKIASQYHKLVSAFSEVKNLKINYAMKALSSISVLSYLKKIGASLDAVSLQEIQLGLKVGFAPNKITFTPNGVSINEIKQAADLKVQINIDSLSVLEVFGTQNPTVPICVRINPHIRAGGNNNISVGHIDSKFGISIHQIPHLIRIVENTKININGIHIHTGSDILHTDLFLEAADVLFSIAKKFKTLEFIDFGSGFKVPYKKNDVGTNIEELGNKLSRRFLSFCKEYGRDLILVLEPGKFLVSQAGYFIAQVNALKQTTSTFFAQVNSGFNHLIRPMFYDAYHEIENISHPDGKERFYSVVGYICETDTFANNRKIREIREGDFLVFHNAGAYCFTMTNNYNSRYRPAEVFFYKGKSHLIRNHENFDDILKNQILLDFEKI